MNLFTFFHLPTKNLLTEHNMIMDNQLNYAKFKNKFFIFSEQVESSLELVDIVHKTFKNLEKNGDFLKEIMV